MAIDASIYSQLLQPVKSVDDYKAESQNNQLNALTLLLKQQQVQQGQGTLQDAQRQRDMQQRLQSGLQGLGAGASDDQRIGVYEGLGMYDAADKIRQGVGTRRKTDAEAAKTELGLIEDKRKAAVQQIASLNSPEEALAILDQQTQAGQVQPHVADALRRIVTTDPKWQLKLIMGVSDPTKMAELLTPHLQTVNAGNAQVQQAVDKLTGKVTETGRTQIFQSPDSVASNETQRLGQKIADARAREAMAQSDRHFNTTQANGGKAVSASEDERKAAGWFAQAENAWKNMQAVALGDADASGKRPIKPAAKQGAFEAIAPSGVANVFRSDDRQKFVQASGSLSEALLRAATGAGVNESEAKQKISELTPQYGDGEQVIRQKFDAIPMYLNSLKTRSGRAAPAAGGVVDFGSLK